MKNEKRMRTIALCLCAVALPLRAESAATSEQTMTFTVDRAVDYAMLHSRTLKSADIDLEIKKRAADNAWNVFLPTVQVSGTMSRQNNIDSSIDSANASIDMANALVYATTGRPGTTSHVSATESMHWAAVGNLGVSWNLSLAYFQQIKAAKANYEGGLISLQQSRKEMEVNVKKLFYGLLLQQENVKLQQQMLEFARVRNNETRALYENGSIPELRYMQSSVAYENQKPDVADAERSFNQQLDMFAFLLGLPVGTKIQLDGSIEPRYVDVDADELLARYGGNSLDMQSLNSSLSVLNLNLKALDLSSYTPALALSWGYQPMLTDALDKDWFDGDNWTDNGSLSVTLAWNLTNLLPFSANRQQAADLRSNISKLQVSMETLRENERMEVYKAVDTLKKAREQIDVMTRNVQLAERSYYQAWRSYNVGTTELLELRDTESQLLQAQLGLANQKYNYISALLDLEKTLNTTLGDLK